MRECLCVFITVRGLLDRRGNKNKEPPRGTNCKRRMLNQKYPIQWGVGGQNRKASDTKITELQLQIYKWLRRSNIEEHPKTH